MASVNSSSQWGADYFIGQSISFEKYNIKNYPLNNNLPEGNKNKRWILSLTNRDGKTLFDHPYLYIICTFKRETGEFINENRRFFTLMLNGSPIFNQKKADGSNIWYEEINQGHIAVVFKIGRESVPNSILNFTVVVENQKEVDDDYRCAECQYTFSIKKPRTTLYFTSGFLDWDIEKGSEDNYQNNEITKLINYGTNVKVWAEESNNNNNKNDTFHNGKIKLSFDNVCYNSESEREVKKIRITYSTETTETTETFDYSNELAIQLKDIDKIEVLLKDDNNYIPLNTTKTLKYWKTYFTNQKIDLRDSIFHQIVETSEKEVFLYNKMSFAVSLPINFPFEVTQALLCPNEENINNSIKINSRIISNYYFISANTEETFSISYDNKIKINNQPKLTQKDYYLVLQGRNYFTGESLFTIKKLENTFSNDEKYVAINLNPNIIGYQNEELYNVKGNVIFIDEYLTYLNNKNIFEGVIIDISNNNFQTTTLNYTSHYGGIKGFLKETSKEKILHKDLFSNASNAYIWKKDTKYTHYSLKNPSKTSNPNNPSTGNHNNNQDSSNTKFLYVCPIITYQNQFVNTCVKEFILCRSCPMDVEPSSIKLKGTTLYYYLNNNGSDQNNQYTANDFVKKRCNSISPSYFGYAREELKERLHFDLETSDREDWADGEVRFSINPSLLSMLLENFKEKTTKKIDFSTLGLSSIVDFINRNKGKKITLTLSLYYDYGNTNDKSKVLFSSIFNNIEITGGEPSFGIRKRGIIVNPKTGNNDLDDGYAQKINVEANEVDEKNVATPLEINVYKEGVKLDSCAIEYKDESFYFDGVDVSKLKIQSDANKTSIGNSTSGLIKDVKDNTLAIGNNSNVINSQIKPYLQGLGVHHLFKDVYRNDSNENFNSTNLGVLNYGDGWVKEVTFSQNITGNSICIPQCEVVYKSGGSITDNQFASQINCTILNLFQTANSYTVKFSTSCPTNTNNYEWIVKVHLYVINLPTFTATTSAVQTFNSPPPTVIETIEEEIIEEVIEETLTEQTEVVEPETTSDGESTE